MPSIKKISLFCLTGITLLFSEITIAQSKNVRTANKPSANLEIDSARATGFYACKVYFSGNGLPYVKVSDYSGSDINLLMKLIDSASNGAIVTIDDLRFISANGKTTMIKQIPYNFNRPKNKVNIKSQAAQQIQELKSYNFVSGIIYFAGFGHPNVSKAKASDTATLNKYYDLSGPGTTITLDNCVYKNVNGSLSSPLSKSIKLQ